MPRNWTLDQSQAEGIYGLSFNVSREDWRPNRTVGPFHLSAGVRVYGDLDQFEHLARSILEDVAAIRAEEGKP